jgi:hypothetical protein
MEKLELKSIVTLFAIVIIVAGIAGMLYCLPFLYSARIEDLVGAGFPFLAGSVLVTGGLISLSINLNKKKES